MLGEKKNYKFLGVLEAHIFKQTGMKDDVNQDKKITCKRTVW